MRWSPRPVPRWARVAVVLPWQLVWLVMVAVGLRLLTDGVPLAGLVFLSLGGMTGYVAVRVLKAAATSSNVMLLDDRFEREGRGPVADYLVWSVLGFPMLMVIALIVLLLTGSAGDIR